MDIVFTNNHFKTAAEALEYANKELAKHGLPLFTYGACGGGVVTTKIYPAGHHNGGVGLNNPLPEITHRDMVDAQIARSVNHSKYKTNIPEKGN